MKQDNTLLFPADALESLHVPGINTRWAAVQQHLHPHLLLLAEQIQAAASKQVPRQWPLYEMSFKSQRYVNHGAGKRAPIDDYHVAFDRPPRGSGILVSISGAERAILVGIQLWGVRKQELRTLWEGSRAVWLPIIERIEHEGQSRFTERSGAKTESGAQFPPPSNLFWIERYLGSRYASYLWAGFVYPWQQLPPDPSERLVDDVLALLPLNEAIMEQAEAPDFSSKALLREQQASYSVQLPFPEVERIVNHMHNRGFALSETTIRAYHVALQTRPFVILPGISGTGKTRLTRLYADAVHGFFSSRSHNPYYLLVAVQPDWHNAKDLLGYYNVISGQYHPTPFLRFLLHAAADPQQPYFVCLDEMNLARPEYYLAPLLSALETSERTIDLGIPDDEVPMVSGEPLRSPLRLPLNLHISGTVNVDESTYSISDKLLDRANIIEMTEVDLTAFRTAYAGIIDEEVWRTLSQVHTVLARAGLQFGYRTIEEILRYFDNAAGVLTPLQALDLQLKQKVLPKLRGEDNPRLRRALGELLTLFLGVPHTTWETAAHIPDEQVAIAYLPASAEKTRRMLQRLEQHGYTDFYD